MTAIEQAQQLQNQAISILLTARQEIDERLAQLGHGEGKKRGRPAGKRGQEKDPALSEAVTTLR